MKKKFYLLFFLLFNFGFGFAQSDTILLESIQINSTRVPMLYGESARVLTIISKDEIRLAPVQTVQDVLQYVAGVDVRQRGAEGVQADLSIRGGSFEQTLVLLNGIKINDPQTGHHNLNIPIDIESIERIEILEGASSRIYGQNAFSGAINIITNTQKNSNIKLNAYYGSFNSQKWSLAGNLSNQNFNQHLAFSSKSSEGYIENTDFNNKNLFYHSKIQTKYGNFNFQAGYLEKKFGANSFYSLRFPNQYEEIETGFGNLKFSKDLNKLKFEMLFNWRRHKDYFILKRDDPTFYQNNHLTDVFGSEINMLYKSKWGETALNFEFRKEKLLSNSMGKDLTQAIDVKNRDAEYLKYYNRDVLSLSAEHFFDWKKMNCAAGFIAHWNNDFGFAVYPGMDFNILINSNLKLISSINTSYRTPSFTDLFYKSIDTQGNINLKPEEAVSGEVGVKWNNSAFSVQLVGFYTLGYNIIDWVKPIATPESLWQAMNISELITQGIELNAQFSPFIFNENAFVKYLKGSFTYLNQTADTEHGFDSKYVMDFLKYKFSLGLQHRLYKSFSIAWQAFVQERKGGYVDFYTAQYTDYDMFILVNSKISFDKKRLSVYLDFNNLLNTNYLDFGNLPMPGRWIKMGVKMNLFSEK